MMVVWYCRSWCCANPPLETLPPPTGTYRPSALAKAQQSWAFTRARECPKHSATFLSDYRAKISAFQVVYCSAPVHNSTKSSLVLTSTQINHSSFPMHPSPFGRRHSTGSFLPTNYRSAVTRNLNKYRNPLPTAR